MADTTSNDYGSGWGEDVEDVTTPSGALCQIRKPGMESLVTMGLLDNVDVLTSVVANVTVPKARTGKAKSATLDVESVMKDPAKMNGMLDMIDKIVIEVVVKPEIHAKPTPDPETKRVERKPGVVYVDQIPLQDRSFIMAMATREVSSLEEFLSKSEEAVGDLSAVPVPAVKAK